MTINLLPFSFLYTSVWKQVERFQNLIRCSVLKVFLLISGLSPSPYNCGDTELRWLNYMPRDIKRLQQYECRVSLKGPMLKLGPQGLRHNELMRWSLVKGRGVKSPGRGCPWRECWRPGWFFLLSLLASWSLGRKLPFAASGSHCDDELCCRPQISTNNWELRSLKPWAKINPSMHFISDRLS